MKKIALVIVIFSLILSTAIIKNSAKKNEDKIFTVKENIRILNSELEKIKLEFDYLSSSDKLLEFQSLEDKIVKYFFKSLSEKKSISRYAPITEQPETLLKLNEKKAIKPSDDEISENLPSRSAKLRYAIKKTDFYDFKTDVLDQFSNLIEIENFGNKLWKKLH